MTMVNSYLIDFGQETMADPDMKVPSGLLPPATIDEVVDPEVTKPNLGRIIAMATLVAGLILMISITVGMAAGEHTGWIDGLGVAAFATFWGGPGFGLIFGGAFWIQRQERWEAQAGSARHNPRISMEER